MNGDHLYYMIKGILIINSLSLRESFWKQPCFVLFKCTICLVLDLVHPFVANGFLHWWKWCEILSLIFHQTFMFNCYFLFPFWCPLFFLEHLWHIDFLNIGHKNKVDFAGCLFYLSSRWLFLDHISYLNITNGIVPPFGPLLGIFLIQVSVVTMTWATYIWINN